MCTFSYRGNVRLLLDVSGVRLPSHYVPSFWAAFHLQSEFFRLFFLVMLRVSFFRRASASASPTTTHMLFLPSKLAGKLSASALRQRAENAAAQRAIAANRVAVMESQRAALRRLANASADNAARAGFVAYVAQTGLLFYWVYVRFDWNLVEPITYLLGYSCVWLSIASFYAKGKEFTYGSWHAMVADRRMGKLVAKAEAVPGAIRHSDEAYAAAVAELEKWEAQCTELSHFLPKDGRGTPTERKVE